VRERQRAAPPVNGTRDEDTQLVEETARILPRRCRQIARKRRIEARGWRRGCWRGSMAVRSERRECLDRAVPAWLRRSRMAVIETRDRLSGAQPLGPKRCSEYCATFADAQCTGWRWPGGHRLRFGRRTKTLCARQRPRPRRVHVHRGAEARQGHVAKSHVQPTRHTTTDRSVDGRSIVQVTPRRCLNWSPGLVVRLMASASRPPAGCFHHDWCAASLAIGHLLVVASTAPRQWLALRRPDVSTS